MGVRAGGVPGVAADVDDAASNTIADALDLRHRLPLVWARVRAGEVRTWQACKIADATHRLSRAAAGFVDQAMAASLTQVPWTRSQRLEAKIIESDPVTAERLAKERAAERFVRTGRSEDGFKTVFARATAGDVVWLDATLDRIAGILAVRGDTDAKDVRRSKALGIIAQPARLTSQMGICCPSSVKVSEPRQPWSETWPSSESTCRA